MNRWIALLAVVASLAAGCASSSVNEVNDVVMAKWESLCDAESRRSIAETLTTRPLRREDYRIGPEDLLAISIFEWELREETRTLEARVTQTGYVSLPVLGRLAVAGHTTAELQTEIERILRSGEILKAPRVTVDVKAFQAKRVSVVGAVREPGVYTLHRNATTLLEVLALAGGPDERAGEAVYIMRTGDRDRMSRSFVDSPFDLRAPAPASEPSESAGGRASSERITVDLYELLELGDLGQDMVLTDGDVVHVPEAAKFFVFGYVREPGGFPLKRPTTVLDGIALARGLREKEASPEHCYLKRRTLRGEQLITLNLLTIARGEAPNLYLKPGDIIEVRQTTGKSFVLGIWDGIKSVLSFGFGVAL